MADWGGIARAVEEGLLDAESGGSSSGGGIRDIAEALTGSNFAGFKMRDIFDKDRWTRRERVNQGRRLEETGIPDYTYDYNPTDRGITTGLGPDNRPVGVPITGEINQAIQENAPWQEDSEDSARRGISNRFGDREFSPRRGRSPLEGRFDRAAASGGGSDQSMGIQGRFGDRTFSPRTGDSPLSGRFDRPEQEAFSQGVTGYLDGRMSVGEARKARAMRNMSQRDREAAGLGDLERYDEFGRISDKFDDRFSRAQDIMRGWDVKDRARNLPSGMGGGPSTRIEPDWGAIEEDMAMRAMMDEFEGRDSR